MRSVFYFDKDFFNRTDRQNQVRLSPLQVLPKKMSDQRKQAYFTRLLELLDKYPKILIVGADNVGSFQMQSIRRSLRGKAEVLMGKNTMIRKAIRGHLSKNSDLEALLPHIRGNVGFIFTQLDLKEIRTLVETNRVAAPARVGSLAPIDVTLPAQTTILDPSQTGFMQALNIATRINKGCIEIINNIHLIKKGEKVGSSEAALLQKLDIKPFYYGLVPFQVYEGGYVFSPSVLDLTDDDILKKFSFGVQNLAALSLAVGFPSVPAVPHYFANAYSSIVAIAVATDYTFDRIAELKNLLDNPDALAALSAQAAAASAPAHEAAQPAAAKEAEKPKEEPKEEEEEDEPGFGDLFG